MKMLSFKGKRVVLMIADVGCITLAAFLAYWLLENYIALPDGYYYVMVGITCSIYILLEQCGICSRICPITRTSMM